MVLLLSTQIPRSTRKEMVMLMNGHDLDFEEVGIGPSRISTPEEVTDNIMPQEFEYKNDIYTEW